MKNLLYAQYDLIVVTPDKISEKQLTIGLLLLPSNRTISLLDLI
jgi:hypothetical protein